MGGALLGGVLSTPALFAGSALLAGFRMQPSGRRGRPSIVRLVVGALMAAAFVFLLIGQIDGWGYLGSVLVDPLGRIVGGAGRGLLHARTELPTLLPATILFALGGLVYQVNQLTRSEVVRASAARPAPDSERIAEGLRALRARDEGFSRVVFLDFVQALYHGLHGWLGTPDYQNLRAFVSEEVMTALAGEAGAGGRVSGIVLGAMKLERIDLASEEESADAITLELEGNYTRERAGAAPVRLVVRERWRLERPRGAVSPAPDRMRALSCTTCGAALSVSALGACNYCNAPLARGGAQWRLARRAVLETESFSTEGLGETVPEEGTELETVRDAHLASEGADLARAEGLSGPDAFAQAFRQDTVAPTFQQMYAAWSTRRWGEVRHLLTDFSWEAQQLWVKAYEAKGLTNKLEDLQLSKVEVARVERDRYYCAVTVRLFASARDYTVDRAGKVVGGDRKRPREFSEYWTFIRSAAAPASVARTAARRCPNCAAPVDRMGSTGICGYCNAKVTTGDFGWVLATITQDEVYSG